MAHQFCLTTCMVHEMPVTNKVCTGTSRTCTKMPNGMKNPSPPPSPASKKLSGSSHLSSPIVITQIVATSGPPKINWSAPPGFPSPASPKA